MNLLRPILIISALSALTSCNNDCPVDMDAMTGSSSEGGGTTNGCMEAPPLPQCDNDGMCEKNEGGCADCSLCGDGNPDPGELCDDGNTLNDDACVDNCQPAICGDGYLRKDAANPANDEVCDDGAANEPSNAWDQHPHCFADPAQPEVGCKALTPYCGDGDVDKDGESCTKDDLDHGCRLDCPTSNCGNSVVEPGEVCDPGSETAECNGAMAMGMASVECQRTVCGDGYRNAVTEDCDDGNAVNTDGCVGCVLSKCGDGFVEQGVEQCDDPNNSINCVECVAVRRVFITKQTFTGSQILGLNGADARCNADAEAKGLTGRFRAWLSDSTGSPSTRFDTSFAGQYVRADGVLIADGWTGLTSSGPMVPINLDVDGNVNEGGVWTNTDPNGMPTNGMTHCSNWTSNMGVSNYGDSSVNDGMWTAAGTNEGCNGGALLYCFEDR